MAHEEPTDGRPGATPRWMADEMVGRLARYLRMVGHDTEYARGLPDEEILRRAESEGRRLLTRDRRLAARSPGAILLPGGEIAEQLRAVHRDSPGASWTPSFERCTLCNGRLARWSPREGEALPDAVPRGRPDAPRTLWRCLACGHVYWEGSHTDRVRRQLAEWLGGAPPR